MVPEKKTLIKKGKKQKKATESRSKYDNVDWQAQTDKVVRYCGRRGFSVKFQKCKHQCSTVCFVEQEIVVHNGSTPERIFYCLLHELGHVLIHENYQMYSQNTGFVSSNFSLQSMTQKISEVEEEYDAWRLGYKLAKKMRLKVDRMAFEKLKASYLSTYFEWAIDRKIDTKIKNAVSGALKKAASKKEK